MENASDRGTLADNLLLTVVNVTPTPWMLRFCHMNSSTEWLTSSSPSNRSSGVKYSLDKCFFFWVVFLCSAMGPHSCDSAAVELLCWVFHCLLWWLDKSPMSIYVSIHPSIQLDLKLRNWPLIILSPDIMDHFGQTDWNAQTNSNVESAAKPQFSHHLGKSAFELLAYTYYITILTI